MNIFISWSGDYSKECAEILRDWIKCTLQASEPWVSSQDIDKGSLWFSEISGQLKDTRVGIVCLTKENKERPWILFESGALAKGIAVNRVCTFLIDLKPTDLEGPLSQFNHTTPDVEGMRLLLKTINKELGDKSLEDNILDQVFTTNWPSFETRFNKIEPNKKSKDADNPSRSSEELLEEVLYTTRRMDRRIRVLESGLKTSSAKHQLHTIDRDGSLNYLDKSEAEEVIQNMIDDGVSLKDIMDHMRGSGPTAQLRDLIKEMHEEKFKLSSDDSHEP